MTSPQPAPPPDQQPPPPQQGLQHPLIDATAVAVIAAALAGMIGLPGFRWGASKAQRRAMLASTQAQGIVYALGTTGVRPDVARVVLGMTLTHSPVPRSATGAPDGSATRAMQETNLQRRAAYLVNAGQRVQRDVDEQAGRSNLVPLRPRPNEQAQPRPMIVPAPDGRRPSPRPTIPGLPPGTPLDPLPEDDAHRIARELAEALARERAYWNAHKVAQQRRDAAAKAVDAAKAKWGDQLTWVARHDARVTKYCAAADGTQFSAAKVPPLGYPGTTHPSCRCRAGPPREGAPSTYDVPPIDD